MNKDNPLPDDIEEDDTMSFIKDNLIILILIGIVIIMIIVVMISGRKKHNDYGE